MFFTYKISKIMLIAKSFSISYSFTSWNHARLRFVIQPSSVKNLLSCCSPSAVSRRIVSIIVFAIKRIDFRWTLTHIFKECKEVFSPFLANSNPFFSVTFVLWISKFIATAFHVHPCAVFRRSANVSFSKSMFIEHNYIIHEKVA